MTPDHQQQQSLRRSTSTPTVHTLTSLEELERLQTRAEKTRHDVLPPQLGARLAAELQVPLYCSAIIFQ